MVMTLKILVLSAKNYHLPIPLGDVRGDVTRR